MSTTVISIGQFRAVHDIDVTTAKGRRCIIDIYENNSVFNSEVTIIDSVSSPSGSWVFNTKPASGSAINNFDAAIDIIKKYLSSVDPQDSIADIHNPCNTPFISESDQNSVLSGAGVPICVRVN